MKKEYVFIISHSGDRTNIISNFKVVNKEDFIKEVKTASTKRWRSETFRYAPIGGTADNVKYMSLETFEELFKEDDFTPQEITRNFRKEVSEKYGEHKLRKQLKNIPNKDLIAGRVYKKADGSLELFLGKLKRKIIYSNETHKNTEQEGFGWLSVHETGFAEDGSYTKSWYKDSVLHRADVLKSNRKVVDVTDYSIPLDDYNKDVRDKSYWSQTVITTITERIKLSS